jgi:methionyl-tRNA formyltransferase
MAPDLMVTAAYGNYLPRAFLDIPRLGTLNIHPSLLPSFRGAAPVQRALESGTVATGVSVAYTVQAMVGARHD